VAYPSTVRQIEDRVRALAADARYRSFFSRFELPHRTWEGTTGGTPGRVIGAMRIGTGVGEGRPRILIVGGMHAREWAPPDAIMTFVEKLLEAYRRGRPMVYARWVDRRTSTPIPLAEIRIPYTPDVKLMVERTELYVVPCANPDGRAFTMPPTSEVGWRKNRRPAPSGVACTPLPAGHDVNLSDNPAGVDLNRNFEIAWDFNRYFSAAAVAAMQTSHTLGVSADPCEPGQTFHGPPAPATGPRAEPETLNIMELLNSKNINFYMDVHSAAGKFLFAWGMEQNQETDPLQTFKNPGFDRTSPTAGGRDGPGTAYREWLPPGSEREHQRLGDSLCDKIHDSTGFTARQADGDPSAGLAPDPIAAEARRRAHYETVQSIKLFGSPPNFEAGVSRDFAFSRSIGSAGSPPHATALDPVFSYTFECGRRVDGLFQPTADVYLKIEREVAVGLAAFISFAATFRAPATIPPPTTPPTPPPPPGTGTGTGTGTHSGCFSALACVGALILLLGLLTTNVASFVTVIHGAIELGQP
jgi:hypothetical protein